MTSQAYEDRSKGIWKTLCTNDEGDDNTHKVISYFCKREHHQPEVTGKVMSVPETHYNRKFNTLEAITLLEDKLFTVKRRGGKRRTLRKKMESLLPYEQYDYAALMMYLNQCYREQSKYCLLSSKELAMILPDKK
ncbi:MAG: hypothetical protein GY861_20590 [bacterium]|nr:hypothetical protein [bacterium]